MSGWGELHAWKTACPGAPTRGALAGDPRRCRGGRGTVRELATERPPDAEIPGGEAPAAVELERDERSPLRGDLIRAGGFAFALTGTARLTDAEGAVLIGGQDTPANRRRFNRALWALRWAGIEVKPGIRWALADAEPGDVNRIGPPRWWLDEMRRRDRLPKGKRRRSRKPLAWRYTGGLFRPATKWGAVERTAAGLEGALAWGSSAGGGRKGRIPDNLRAGPAA